MKKTVSIMLTLLLTGVLTLTFNIQPAGSSGPPPTEWSRTYGGAEDDVASSVVQTVDGGYAMAGSTESFGAGASDFWLVKTDAAGNMEWSQTYGGTDGDEAYALVQTVDGGYAMAGSTESFGAWLVKADATGNLLWDRKYGGLDYSASSLVQTSDGGYALVGTHSFDPHSEIWLVKVDSLGNVQWQTYFGGYDHPRSLKQTSDGGYIIAGVVFDKEMGVWSAFLAKADSSGNWDWKRTYGGMIVYPYLYHCYAANSVVQTSDGGYALAGDMYWECSGESDVFLIKTDSAGNMEWNQTYGDEGDDVAQSVVQTSDGGYALAGYGFANLVKTDSSGNLLWSSDYGGTAYSMVEASDGGYVLAGVKDGDFWLVKTAGWDVILEASLEGYSDVSDFGVRNAATDGFDPEYDHVDPPPPPGSGVVSYFWYPDNPTTPVDLRKLSTSKIPPSSLMTWTYKVKPVALDGALCISWSATDIAHIPPKCGVYLQRPDGSLINMRQETQYCFAAEADTTYTFTVYVCGCDFELQLSTGWNMVSFPCLPMDPGFSSIFSDVGYYQVLTWDGTSYMEPTIAEAGRGYWVLVLSDTTVTIISGVPVEHYELDLPAGWRIIGSILPCIVDADCVFPSFYQMLTWDGTSYVGATTIESGKGYWALVLEPTHIIVDSSCCSS